VPALPPGRGGDHPSAGQRPGALRFAFRHFPLSRLHPLARRAAEASEAAAAQGAFWPMHDRLFAHGPALVEPQLMAIAAELGLDVERLAMELSNGVHAPRVQRDISSGARSGVNGTPTFFINGKRYDGPYDLDLLRAAIDAAAGG
jgi:protein-disulfide isomerase